MRIPVATYRLQFGPSFGFRDAQPVVAYLATLGISDIYASPILKATEDSAHGYDVTDPSQINPQLGNKADFDALTTERQAHSIGWLQDIVPNHMAYSSENELLTDVLEQGPGSEYFEWFDIFRDHPDPALQTRVLAPFLGGPLEDILRQGELRLELDRDGLALRYYNWRFPVSLTCYDEVLRRGLSDAALPSLRMDWTDLAAMAPGPERNECILQAKKKIARLASESEEIHSHLQGVLDFYNRTDDPSALLALIDRQWYKPVFWQTAKRCINYRRFFYLNDFISLRAERPAVFERIHSRILELAKAGVITGLRVDHIDGLHDPLAYLYRLREHLPHGYLVVEKILEMEETLPTRWPIDGTSGYKFCNYVNGLFCDCGSEPAFTDIYHKFIGETVDHVTQLHHAKLGVLRKHMGGEVAYLAGLLAGALDEANETSPEAWQEAVEALIATFPVYRTYIDAEQFTDHDRACITAAVLAAKKLVPDREKEVDHIGQFLLSYRPLETALAQRDTHRYLVMRFQQFTGPAMAKGLEDTLFYTYNRFISVNEVGGDPGSFGVPLDRFHAFNEMRARHWPTAMNTTSTHDAKRGEDIRARLNVLSEMPDRWREKVQRWAEMNASYREACEGTTAPDANDEYLLYQTLVGALPFDEQEWDNFRQRMKDYTVKALREAKRHTSWTEPSERYESGCLAFVDHLLDRDPQNAFWSDFLPFQKEVSTYGIYNSLAQTTLKITCPGVPDFYQGAELWDLNLVDPDNRRPVDFAGRSHVLASFQNATVDANVDLINQLMDSREDGRIKLFLIHSLLSLRTTHRTLFEQGDYTPLDVSGPLARHIVAFLRTDGTTHALVVVPRFLSALIGEDELPTGEPFWRGTQISLPDIVANGWMNAITGEPWDVKHDVQVAQALACFPVGVLLSNRRD